MRLGKKTRITAIILTLMSPAVLGVFTPSSAEPSVSPLIDKEFETALRKFVSKRFFTRIGASPEQKEKLSKIMADTQDGTRPLREELRQGMLVLSSLMADDKNSEEQIRAKVQELRAIHEKLQDKRLSAALEARKILTAEQREKMHTRFTQLITGGLAPRRIGMLLQSGGDNILGD